MIFKGNVNGVEFTDPEAYYQAVEEAAESGKTFQASSHMEWTSQEEEETKKKTPEPLSTLSDLASRKELFPGFEEDMVQGTYTKQYLEDASGLDPEDVMDALGNTVAYINRKLSTLEAKNQLESYRKMVSGIRNYLKDMEGILKETRDDLEYEASIRQRKIDKLEQTIQSLKKEAKDIEGQLTTNAADTAITQAFLTTYDQIIQGIDDYKEEPQEAERKERREAKTGVTRFSEESTATAGDLWRMLFGC